MSNMPRGTFMQVMEKYTKSLKAFISAQGFGHYSKPNGGIPKTDLDQSVQTSLGKADTALQSFTETDPTVPAWAKASSKPSYTASEVGLGKVGNFKAVSTEASQGLSDTEKANARANMGGGTYSKPSGGIPKTDLASAVQTSLGKADTALQTFTESDPTVPAWAKASTKPSYTASEVGLGNVGNFKAVSTVASQGLSDTEKANARTNIGAGTSSFSGSYNDLSDKPTIPTKVSQLTNDSGYTANTGTVTGVKVGSTSYSPSSGVVSLPAYPTTLPASDVSSWAKASTKPSYTASEVGLGNVGNFKAVSTVASQGLSDTEKSNARANIGAGTGNGTYSKPSGGIPKSDLASAVQTSLGKADSALQSETDPTVPAWAKASTKPSYTASEVGLGNVGNFKAVSTVASQGLSNTEKSNARANIGAGTSSFSGSYNDLSNKPTIPTKTSQLTNDSGYTANTGTVTGVKVGSTSYSPSSGVVSLPAYPTTLPASDVSSWAKAASKPSYTASEVGLGNVGNFKAVSTVASQGLSDTEKANARANIGAGTSSFSGSYNDLSNKPTSLPASDVYSWAKASTKPTYTASETGAVPNTTVSGSPDLDTYLTTGVYHITTSTATHAPTTNHATLFVDATVGTPYQIFKPDNIDATWYTRHRSGSAWTAWVAMKFTDTTYSAATTSAAGLMSATDKSKLDGLPSSPSGFTKFSTLPGTAITQADYGGFANYGPIVFFNALVYVPSGANKKFALFKINFDAAAAYSDNYPLPPIIVMNTGVIQEGGFSIPVADSYTKPLTDCYLQVDCKIMGGSSGNFSAYLMFDETPTSQRSIGINCSYLGKK